MFKKTLLSFAAIAVISSSALADKLADVKSAGVQKQELNMTLNLLDMLMKRVKL